MVTSPGRARGKIGAFSWRASAHPSAECTDLSGNRDYEIEPADELPRSAPCAACARSPQPSAKLLQQPLIADDQQGLGRRLQHVEDRAIRRPHVQIAAV